MLEISASLQSRRCGQRFRFHDLRYANATLLLAKGKHPKLVQALLGHSRVSMTLNIYSHITPALRREVADTMDTLLRETLG